MNTTDHLNRPNTPPNFIDEKDLGPELTEENCTEELWNEIKPTEVKKKSVTCDGIQIDLKHLKS